MGRGQEAGEGANALLLRLQESPFGPSFPLHRYPPPEPQSAVCQAYTPSAQLASYYAPKNHLAVFTLPHPKQSTDT